MNRAWALATFAMIPVAVWAAEPEHGTMETVDGVNIHYMTMGTGTPVILIHGYTGSAEGNWFSNGVAEELAKTNRVVAIDVRGHGLSDKPKSPDRYGAWMWQDIIAVMNHLDIEEAHVHGYSMGGYMTTQLITHYPNRFITASYGGSGIAEVDPEWRSKVPPDVEGSDPQEAEARETLSASPMRDDEALATVRQNPPWSGPEARWIDLTALEIPVLAINGEFDRPNAKTHRMAREIKDFESVTLKGKSHLTAIMAGYIPQQYIDTLAAFIRTHDPQS